ncbi:MAG TPA: hypothetical protein VF624_04280 [Tepidisphaeraceae bacterium]|jgi:hypothetical protein
MRASVSRIAAFAIMLAAFVAVAEAQGPAEDAKSEERDALTVTFNAGVEVSKVVLRSYGEQPVTLKLGLAKGRGTIHLTEVVKGQVVQFLYPYDATEKEDGFTRTTIARELKIVASVASHGTLMVAK